jgi:hypothetical protein
MAVLRAANYAKAVHDCTGSFYHHAAFSLRIHASAAVDISALRIGIGAAGSHITSRPHSL